ncbi:MAG: hypothetical protein ACPLRX_06380 [Candidatus Saccharicenans sp.]
MLSFNGFMVFRYINFSIQPDAIQIREVNIWAIPVRIAIFIEVCHIYQVGKIRSEQPGEDYDFYRFATRKTFGGKGFQGKILIWRPEKIDKKIQLLSENND